MAYVLVALAALLIGLVLGFVTFKRSSSWCKDCGHPLRCPHCAVWPVRTR